MNNVIAPHRFPSYCAGLLQMNDLVLTINNILTLKGYSTENCNSILILYFCVILKAIFLMLVVYNMFCMYLIELFDLYNNI